MVCACNENIYFELTQLDQKKVVLRKQILINKQWLKIHQNKVLISEGFEGDKERLLTGLYL